MAYAWPGYLLEHAYICINSVGVIEYLQCLITMISLSSLNISLDAFEKKKT